MGSATIVSNTELQNQMLRKIGGSNLKYKGTGGEYKGHAKSKPRGGSAAALSMLYWEYEYE